ncbi:MAG: peptidoglycan glycosyltransferase [Lachnospiraceae bacterium]|nr:peptidoglycan glycosyltransferase [Lachnospiraceae bacterium]
MGFLMLKNKTKNREKVVVATLLFILLLLGLMGRLVYFMVFQSDYYSKKAEDLHVRERYIKAKRGKILDRNGVVLADNITVCNVSVIHNQIQDKEKVIKVLCEELNLSREYVEKRVNKVSSIEKIKSNVSKEIGDKIRDYNLAGIKVDEDYKRYYPYGELASKVLGFTGGDNQGILGLEVKYEEQLQGEKGIILTTTDARGIEIETKGESRREPIDGNNLVTSLDYNIQSYATQLAKVAMETKEAERVSIIAINPQNGEIYCMVDVPEFDLNQPYELSGETELALQTTEKDIEKARQEALNQMWRNGCINDTYEPGSTFKIITTAAALEEKVVSLEQRFYCPGYIMVEDRRIRCHKYGGHGSVSFVEAIQGSCNPTFISLGLTLGVDRYYDYFSKFGLLNKTGIDLPGEAGTIMHKKESIGPVELATVAFGQSFQISPIQMVTCVSGLINGGKQITPHLAVKVQDENEKTVKIFAYKEGKKLIEEETSATLQYLLEKVVDGGTGSNGYVEGFRVGGKTATSQTLPRNSGKYIASYIGFAPADDPQILAIAIVHNPKGVYYGGQVAAPIIRQLFENILPYLERM